MSRVVLSSTELIQWDYMCLRPEKPLSHSTTIIVYMACDSFPQNQEGLIDIVRAWWLGLIHRCEVVGTFS